MGREVLAVLVMLNNYAHDFAVAVLFCSILTSVLLGRELVNQEQPEAVRRMGGRLLHKLTWVVKGALLWTLLGGVVRALAYREFEWVPAAGNAQVPALIFKHLLLAGLVVASLAMLIAQRRRLREEGIDPEATVSQGEAASPVMRSRVGESIKGVTRGSSL